MSVHHHSHQHRTGRVLNWSVAATILFVLVELAAGLRAGSLALISDAGHNFTDALSLVLAAIGLYLESRPADSVKTYGYHRAGVLTAFVNALTLVGISLFIFYEAWQRFLHPRAVQQWTMFWVALAAVALNGAIMWSLHRDKDRDLNIRAAFIHMLGDAISSMAIVAGAVLIYFTGLSVIDPILSVLIGALIVWTAWDIIKESLNVLLEGLPRGMEL
ncbi:MAG TPA: cation diffusion facilitator family transporter, partial [Bryobacteraceae bacterium]|nr:cation diffusion facilitator family transporter [Bryobacteraceae bacterium]